MRFVSVRELKATPSEFLRLAAKGETVVIASRGKPTAVLQAISEEELEDYILENSQKIKRLVAKGERDRRAGRVTPLEARVPDREGSKRVPSTRKAHIRRGK